MKAEDQIAIDFHPHAGVSCWNLFDNCGEEYDRAADKCFGSNLRPTIDATVAHDRKKTIGLVMLTVDSEAQLGRRSIPNDGCSTPTRCSKTACCLTATTR